MDDKKDKVVGKYRTTASTLTDLFGQFKKNTDVIKQGYAAMGMLLMNRETLKAIDMLLKQDTITKKSLKILKQRIKAFNKDCVRQMQELADEQEKNG